MEEQEENEIELEIREHSDADFFPENCPFCKLNNIKRFTYHLREIPDLGTLSFVVVSIMSACTLNARNVEKSLP